MPQADYYHTAIIPLAALSTLHSPLLLVLYWLRRALPYANAGCPFRAILMNT
ncbi:MAG: hypothetical protein LBE12_10060 [Planctomycetaceae bacterium]|nr:hypothetical protein [Planctomycetaceae bacterium]